MPKLSRLMLGPGSCRRSWPVWPGTREIARLNFRQAQLEWEAAEKQYELGTLEEGALNQVRLALRQAQLDYWEACHRHDLAKRRLSQGIGGDLLGGMSR